VRKYFLTFKVWGGAPIKDTYNNKAVIDWNGEPVFAELAILRLFQANGWDGVWVDSYRRKYRTDLPEKHAPVELPAARDILLENIRAKTGRFGGCWDVFAWKGEQILFIESKRQGKDAIQESQIQWLKAAMELKRGAEDFLIIEWGLK